MVTDVDLQYPLRSLVPSLDWAVLEVLAGTRSGLGASQIARLAKAGSRSGQASILDRLVEHGLVIAEPANHGFLYRLNRDHLLTPAVVGAAGTRALLLDRLAEATGHLSPPPAHASVFGSFARGEAGIDSDIDVLLLAATEEAMGEWGPQIEGLEDRVRSWTGNRCSCMAFTMERAQELANNGEPIVTNWITDGLVLLGDPVERLLDEPVSKARPGRSRRGSR